MLSMKSVASALVHVASAADIAVPVLVAPALVLAVSTAVRAETPSQAVRHEVVRYDDLNLASPAGHAAAMVRIQRAAYRVCREIPWEGVGVHTNWVQYLDCAKAATEAAAAQLPAVSGR